MYVCVTMRKPALGLKSSPEEQGNVISQGRSSASRQTDPHDDVLVVKLTHQILNMYPLITPSFP